MKKENEIDFVSLLQNETFFRLTKDTIDSENQVDILEKEFPGQREAIGYAIEFVKANLLDQKNMEPGDVARVWHNLREYAGQRSKFTLHRFVSHELWKVAAIFIVVLTTSYGIYHYTRIDPLTMLAQKEVSKN